MLKSLFSALTLALLLAANLQADQVRLPGKQDRCPICGMFVAPYPEWTSIILFADGTQLFFDGAKDLFRYYFALPSAADPRNRDDIKEILLSDYYSTRLLPVAQLYFVLGSDVYGPMGHELVPVAGKAAAETFARDHNGKSVLSFDQLTPAALPGE